MPYSFSVEAKPGYLHVRVSGENTPVPKWTGYS